MTDLQIAIQRMRSWIRDYGDKKPGAFVGDVTILLCAAEAHEREYRAATERIETGGIIDADCVSALASNLEDVRQMQRDEITVRGEA